MRDLVHGAALIGPGRRATELETVAVTRRVLPVDLVRPMRLLGEVAGGDYLVQTIGSSGYYGKLFRVDGITGDFRRIGRSYDLYREPRSSEAVGTWP